MILQITDADKIVVQQAHEEEKPIEFLPRKQGVAQTRS